MFSNTVGNFFKTSLIILGGSDGPLLESTVMFPNSSKSHSPCSLNAFIMDFKDTGFTEARVTLKSNRSS